MSRILYIPAANYDGKHLENSEMDSKTPGFFFLQKNGNPE